MKHLGGCSDAHRTLGRDAVVLPPAGAGTTIGLFGGSFNPPHPGHRLVAETALRRLGLDRVWWIVTPGNPLKDHGELRPIGERFEAVRRLARGPAHVVTAFEAAHRIRYTADTVRLVLDRRPGARFVWIMGADSLASFHRWQDWRAIVRSLPIAVVDRPGSTLSVLSAPMAQAFASSRVPEERAASLASCRAPAWTFLHGPRSAASSSLLRGGLARTS